MSDTAAIFISLSAILIFCCVMIVINAFRYENKLHIVEIIDKSFKAQGFYTPAMATEAGFNQPVEDCDFSRDETAYLKAGVYVKAYDFDEHDPVFIRVMSDGCLNKGRE